jgi:rSAM/selenodomain-associated transferase 1
MHRANNTLILFTKTPQICRVKTRMQPELSHRECLYLHKKLTAHAISQFKSSNKFKLVIYATHVDNARHIYPRTLCIKQQSGLDIGLRMHNAIKQEIKHTQRVVLIGSDCLTLDVNYVCSAFNHLSKLNDIVLGPTIDGGYALIGMKNQNAFLFDSIPWGTSEVLDKTLESGHKHGCRIQTLEKISDLDTIEDLDPLIKLNTLPEWAVSLVRNRAISFN